MIRTLVSALLLCLLFATLAFAATEIDQSPFGMNGLGLMFGKDHPSWDGWAKEAAVLRDAGIYWTRFDFWWGVVEPKKHTYDWAFADQMAQFYREQHINAMPILCYSSAWYRKPPDNAEERARYANFVYQVVNRYKDTYHVYEIWNEPNIPSFWNPPNVRDYTLMLIEAYKAAKKADPNCVIIAAATSEPDLTFIKGIHDNGGWDSCDGISIHPYPMAPGGAIGMRLDKILRIINGYIASTDKHKTLWTTEMGWTADGAIEEKDQAINMFQSYVISMANGMSRLYFFSLGDWSVKWGIVKTANPLVPKQAYKTYKLMTDRFGSPGPAAAFEGYLKMPDGVAGYVFKKKGDERLLVLWSNDAKTHAVQIGQESGLSATDILGAPVKTTGGWIGVEKTPIIVTGADARKIGPVSNTADPLIDPKGTNLCDNPAANSADGKTSPGWQDGSFHHRLRDNATYAVSKDGRNATTCISISKSKGWSTWENRLIPVFPGSKIRMTGWIKTKDATGDNCLALVFYNGSGWRQITDARTKTITGTHDWQKVSVEEVVPVNSPFLRPNLLSEDNSGTAWFDDIEVVEE